MRTGKVVVLGGTGFIGQAFVPLLLQRGYRVTVVSRQLRAGNLPRAGVEFVRGAVGGAECMRRVIPGADVVCHLAPGGGETWAEFERDYIHATRTIATACLEHGVQRLVYASSIAALYLGSGGSMQEDRGTDPKPLRRSQYSRAKGAAEAVLKEFQKQDLPVVILRPGVVVGRGGPLNHGGLGQFPADTCCLAWGGGNTPLPFVLAEDVAQAFLGAVEAPGIEGKSFNLAGDVCLSAREFVKIVAERSHRNFRFYPQSLVKMQLLDIGKWILKVIARKPDNSFPSFRDLKSRTLRTHLDCSAAKRDLGWRPNDSLEVFLRETIDANLPEIPPGDLRLAHAQ